MSVRREGSRADVEQDPIDSYGRKAKKVERGRRAIQREEV